jgi:predicted Rossmann-fold nucleotide-binding protein
MPIVLLNFEGFYDGLLEWISLSTRSGFISKGSASGITVVNTLEELPMAIERSKLALHTSVGDDFDWQVVMPKSGELNAVPL